ncbi:hypothetical protein KM043_016976 [Ampulex compressa]|nr:hypothetical protein KM043_016976 [Ampulex compressa]
MASTKQEYTALGAIAFARGSSSVPNVGPTSGRERSPRRVRRKISLRERGPGIWIESKEFGALCRRNKLLALVARNGLAPPLFRSLLSAIIASEPLDDLVALLAVDVVEKYEGDAAEGKADGDVGWMSRELREQWRFVRRKFHVGRLTALTNFLNGRSCREMPDRITATASAHNACNSRPLWERKRRSSGGREERRGPAPGADHPRRQGRGSGNENLDFVSPRSVNARCQAGDRRRMRSSRDSSSTVTRIWASMGVKRSAD